MEDDVPSEAKVTALAEGGFTRYKALKLYSESRRQKDDLDTSLALLWSYLTSLSPTEMGLH